MARRGRHPEPEHHHAREEPSRNRRRHGPTRRRRTPSPPPRQRREERDDRRGSKSHVSVVGSAEMSRPRLRSEIGEVRGSLERIGAAEYMACEAAATATPSPSKESAATHDTEAPFSDGSAVHGFAGTGNSLSSVPKPPVPVRRTSNQPLFTAVPGPPPHPNADVDTPVSKRRKTTVLEPPPMKSTNAPATFKQPSQQDVPERRQHTNAADILKALQHVVVPEPEPEPDVLARASSLRTRYADIISKANETLSANRQQKLKKKLQPKPAAAAADDDAIASGEDEEAEMCREALRKEEERKAQVASQRKTAREELLEVERKARLTMDEELPPGAPMDGRQCSPAVEIMLGLFVKSEDSGDEDI